MTLRSSLSLCASLGNTASRWAAGAGFPASQRTELLDRVVQRLGRPALGQLTVDGPHGAAVVEEALERARQEQAHEADDQDQPQGQLVADAQSPGHGSPPGL